MMRILSACSVLLLLLTPACSDDTNPGKSGSNTSNSGRQNPQRNKPERPVRINMANAKVFWGADPSVFPKVDNPITPEKVALGRMLFHEQHLSKNGDISCASCHDLANYGQDGKPVSPGTAGQMGRRNTPTVYNSARQYKQFWDYRADNVEAQAIMPVLNPIEHGLEDEAEVVSKIKEKPELVEAFGKAFPGGDPVTVENFGLALGAFQRTLVTKSRFDDFLDGNSGALTQPEKKGLQAFIDVGCTQCHMSRLVGGGTPQKLGVFGRYPDEDTGRFEVSGNDAEKFMFKVPSLLNVEKTAPYCHDGKVETLEDVVRLMADIQLDKKITDAQVDAIVLFLKTLTGKLPEDSLKK